MTTPIIGPTDSSVESLPKQLEALEASLEAYEQHHRVSSIGSSVAAEKYLQISQRELSKMTDVECGEAAVLLSQYASYIQKTFNKEKSRLNWANALLVDVIAVDAGQYEYKTWEERKSLATKNNEFALRLRAIINTVQGRVDRLEHLSYCVHNLSQTFIELQKTKRRSYNG